MKSSVEMQLKVLENALDKTLLKNEESAKFWRDYKKGHEKVVAALNTFVKELKVNCMVPVGSRALLKGTLIHTNEILTSIGDGYFVKHSAQSAIELCERRMNYADEMLEHLTKEQDLFETRKILPFKEEVFGGENTKEINEYWEETEVDNWKKKHREREKEYRQKLVELRSKEVKKIETEDDLFERLEQLELEEELADELNRLESDDEFAEEEEESEDSDIKEEIEREIEKLKNLRLGNSSEDRKNTEITENMENRKNAENTENSENKGNTENTENKDHIPKSEPNTRLKRVSFADKDEIKEEESEDLEDTIRIEFSHGPSNTHTNTHTSSTETGFPVINTPADIDRLITRTKSILKRRENDLPNRDITDIPEQEESENEGENTAESLYEVVVGDVRERIEQPSTLEDANSRKCDRTEREDGLETQPKTDFAKSSKEDAQQQRPVSKFRRERNLRST